MFWPDLVSLISGFLKMPHLPRYDPPPTLAAPSPRWSALLAPFEQPEACQVYPTQVPEGLGGHSLEGLLGSEPCAQDLPWPVHGVRGR